jgi:ATP-dependent exoDNAse (exonuclease V) beta subunit
MADTRNEAQHRAVVAEESILCCACPGSGKTKVLVTKVRHILKTHRDPWIVMTTFSRDAADEMMERISGSKDKGKKRCAAPLTQEQLKRIYRHLQWLWVEVRIEGRVTSFHIEARHHQPRLHDATLEFH